jgi:UDP-N-acetylglucosamine:LPS N-acetylglucosamine transferase
LVRSGAAEIIQERDLDAGVLSGLIRKLCGDRARLLVMAETARAGAVTDAASVLAEYCIAAGAAA